MPALNRKHDDLHRTASVPGQKKLAFEPISRKTAETEVSFNSFHCFQENLGKLLSREKSRSSLTDKDIYDYLKNHHVPMKDDTLFKNLVTKKGSSFFLSFKMKWLEENPWLVYSKELEGGFCKFCVLFDEKHSNRGIFVKRAFQDVGKPEKIREHTEPNTTMKT